MKSKSKIKIKKATKQDILDITNIHKSCVKIINAKFYPKNVISLWLKQITEKNIKDQLHNSKWLVLKLNDKTIGFAQYSIQAKTLYQINISPKYSGKGFGKILYSYIENEFLKNKAKTIKLNSTLNAVPFYKNLGFKKIKNISFKIDSASIKMVAMKKNLHI